jgi:two-component system CheB/CheR fusion protein
MIESTPGPNASLDLLSAGNFSIHLLPFGGQERSSESASAPLSGQQSKARRWALVVDDVSDMTEMLSTMLSHAGYDVSTASSAPDAITLARDHHFDVVISDIGMPKMNGYELAGALRSLPGYESVPLIALTGYSMFDDRDRSLNAGFNEHVTKPISPHAFLELIEQLRNS